MADHHRYRFGEFAFDAIDRQLSRRGQILPLAVKACDLLRVLLRHAGRTVSKDALLHEVWANHYVDAGILTVHVSAIRKALGDDARAPTFVETVARRGYRFIAGVRIESDTLPEGSAFATPIELHELVGRGRWHLLSGSSGQLPLAEAAFQAAIQLDVSYAPAHAGLALTRCAQALNRVVPCRDAYAHAKTAALRALAIDSCSADAQVALGTVLFVSEWDWKGARRSLERALATDPDHPEALLQYGAVRDALSPAGKAEGLAFKQRALERAPHSALVFVEIAISLQLRRDVEQAILWARRATEADPINIRASNLLAALYLVGGNIGAFLQERRRLTTVPSPVSRSTRWGEELAHARNLGRQQFLRLLLTALTGNSSYDDLQRAALYGALGDLDDAFCCLDRALGERDPLLVFLGVHPLWDSLRDDPRYKERIQAMGLIDDGAKQPQRHAHSA